MRPAFAPPSASTSRRASSASPEERRTRAAESASSIPAHAAPKSICTPAARAASCSDASSAENATVYPSASSPWSAASINVRPGPPRCEMWIERIGVVPGGQAPMSSMRSRLAADSASVRASPEGPARASSRRTRRPARPRRVASVAPTGPAPTMATSVNPAGASRPRTPSAVQDRVLDVLHLLRAVGGEHLASLGRHQHVVLDAHADVPEGLGHVVGGADVAAGLDRQHHAGLQLPPLALLHVVARVVHVEPEPVAG